jgi:hypothetical protein
MFKLSRVILIGLIILLLAPALVSAQATSGTVSGTVFLDANADGFCVATGDVGLAGVPLEFVSGDTTIFLESGDDGTYALVAAGFSTWQVTAQPGSDYVVTSENPKYATIDQIHPTATGVDFCVAQVGTVSPVLPQSGASIAPILLAALLVGAGFLIAGISIEYRRRHTT